MTHNPLVPSDDELRIIAYNICIRSSPEGGDYSTAIRGLRRFAIEQQSVGFKNGLKSTCKWHGKYNGEITGCCVHQKK